MSENKLVISGFTLLIFVLLILTYFYLNDYLSNKIFYAIILAAVLTGLNFSGAIFSVKISLKREPKSSLNTYIIGMGIRIPIFLTALIISMLLLDINHNSLIFSVLIFYIYFLIMEIIFLNIGKK